MESGVILMAKRGKGRPKTGEVRQPAATTADGRVVIINLKGTEEYAAFLDELHSKTHIPKASIIRLAVAEWSARNGHGVPPNM